MSLQIWLPLIGDTDNKGVYDDSKITRTGTAVFDDNGKIGKCLKSGLSLSSAENPMRLTGTIAFWIYVDENTVTGTIYGNNATGAALDNRKWSLFLFPDRNSLHSWGCMLDDNSSPTNGSYTVNNCIPDNKWTHVAVSHDETNQYIYINGDLVQTVKWNNVSGPITFDVETQIVYSQNRKINDLRIYDECLSQRQIHELAKGLVAHYKLSRPMPNCFRNADFEKGTEIWTGVNSSTIRIETQDGRKVIAATKGTSDNLYGQTISYYYGKVNEHKHLMFTGEFYVEEAGTFRIAAYINSNGWQGVTALVDYKLTNTFKPGWNKMRCTIRISHATVTGNVIIAIGYTKAVMKMYHPKIEEVESINDDRETGWIPYSTDLTYNTLGYASGIENDCSGYGYDLNYSIDQPADTVDRESPLYKTSMNFRSGIIDYNDYDLSAAQYLYREPFTFLNHALTFSCWIYQKSDTSWSQKTEQTAQAFLSQGRNYNYYGINLQTWKHTNNVRYIRVYLGDDTTRVVLDHPNVNLNTWYHVVATWDGTTVKLYINGALSTSNNVNIIDYTDAPAFVIGKMAYGYTSTTSYFPFVGDISDVRIYSTALSAADIKELYNTRASIDNKGNYHTYELMEG